jgi:hypothetical protein
VSIQVAVYDSANTFIANVPRRKGVSGMEEHNTPGSCSFDIEIGDATLLANPDLLDFGNIVQYSINGTKRKAWLIESVAPVTTADGARMVRVSGRGVLAWLANGTVYPQDTLKRDSADERSFDYGAAQGPWYDPSEWNTPLGVAKSSVTSIRYPFPRDWPDSLAQWIWSSPGPNVDTPPGYNFFRGGFSLPAETRVAIYAAGDDAMELQLDNEVILQSGYGQWVRPAVWTGYLPAGYHLLAAWVYNHGTAAGGDTAGGFICSVIKVDRNNKAIYTIKRSQPSGFLVYNEANAPGWFPASILRRCLIEADARNVAGFSNITTGFTDTDDYTSVAWTQRHNVSFPIGTTDLLDLATRLTEHDCDIDMSPTFVLRAWKQRGVDRTDEVTFGPGVVTHAEASGSVSRVRNRALVRHKRGWIMVNDSTSESTYGRRETGMSVGGAGSDAQADRSARAGFENTKDPEVTISVTTSSVKGPQPWADFDIYDLVNGQGLSADLEPCRVMSWAFREDDDTGRIDYETTLYPETA